MIQTERSTQASAEELWSFLGDLGHWADILPTMQRVTRLSGDGANEVGDRFDVRQPGLPPAVYEIIDWQPGQGFTWVSASPGVRTTASHRLERQDGATVLVLGIEWDGPLAWLVRLVFGRKTQRMIEQEADTFVRLAEHA